MEKKIAPSLGWMDGWVGEEGRLITVKKNLNLIVSRRKKMAEKFSTKDKTLEAIRCICFYGYFELGFIRPHILVFFIV